MKGYIQNLKQRYHLKDYRFSLVILVTALSIIGVFIVGSAQADLQWRQLQGVILGLIAMFIISLIDYNWILKFYWVMYAVNLVLLAAVLLFGETVNGATRWLNLGFIQFQPSDLTKLLMILFFAKFLMDREQKINDKNDHTGDRSDPAVPDPDLQTAESFQYDLSGAFVLCPDVYGWIKL